MNKIFKPGDATLADINIQEDAAAYYQVLQEQAPVWFDEQLNTYIISTYDLVKEALRRTDVFSSIGSQTPQEMRTPPEEVQRLMREGVPRLNLLTTDDEPTHSRHRKIVDYAFTARRIREQVQESIVEITDTLLEDIADKGEVDFVSAFATVLPIYVIADQIGLPREMAPKFKIWSDASVAQLGIMISDEEWIEAARLIHEMHEYFMEEITARRKAPREDLLTVLITAEVDGEQPLNDAEIVNILQQILVAGNETTTNSLSGGMQWLIGQEGVQARLRAEPDLVPRFVEEVLRLESPVQGLFRIVKEDTELGGFAIPKGARVMLRYAAANRDPSKFPNPGLLDLDRTNAGAHLAFAAGIHHCLGANLSRGEMNAAFSAILKRMDNLAFAPGKNDFTHYPNLCLRGLKELHITFDKIA